MNHLTKVLMVVLIVPYATLIAAAPAFVQAQPTCDASFNGVPVEGRTLRVDRNAEATVEVAVPGGPTQNSVYVEFFGKRWEVASVGSEGDEWSWTMRVSEYARWAVGLYKVVWESRNLEGQIVCRTSASIQIVGSPLGTVTGVAGVVGIAVGLTALTLTLRTTINEGARWAIKVVAKAKVQKDKERRRLHLKPTISVSQTLLGTLWGLLLSGGTMVMLQQTALSLPTIELSLDVAIPLILLSLLASWFRLVRE